MAIPILHLHPAGVEEATYLLIQFGAEEIGRGIKITIQVSDHKLLRIPLVTILRFASEQIFWCPQG